MNLSGLDQGGKAQLGGEISGHLKVDFELLLLGDVPQKVCGSGLALATNILGIGTGQQQLGTSGNVTAEIWLEGENQAVIEIDMDVPTIQPQDTVQMNWRLDDGLEAGKHIVYVWIDSESGQPTDPSQQTLELSGS